jgi:acyl carrier protein
VVSVREDQPEEPRLVAYVVVAEGAAPMVSTLRRALGDALPAHMVPTVFVYLQALPRTPNGKVARSALPSPDGQRPTLSSTYARPRTRIEETLAGIWAEVLLVDPVGIHDEFLDLGGDSLRAARIIARGREAFGVDVPAARLLGARTVAHMAVTITEHLLSLENPGAAARLVREARTNDV